MLCARVVWLCNTKYYNSPIADEGSGTVGDRSGYCANPLYNEYEVNIISVLK